MEIVVLDNPDDEVIARGSYSGGPAYEFIVTADGHIDWRVVGDSEVVWAAPDLESFRRIVAAWKRYKAEYQSGISEDDKPVLIDRLRRELDGLGALPSSVPADPEPLWSLLLFEAEQGLG